MSSAGARSARPTSVVTRRVQAFAPPLLIGLAIGVAIAAFCVESGEASHSALAARTYATLDLFAGNYVVLPGQDPEPSSAVAVLAVLALLLTFGAVVTAMLSVTARARAWWWARRSGSDLVVGSGIAAAEILRLHRPRSRRSSLLVTDDERGAAAVAAGGNVPYAVADIGGMKDAEIERLGHRTTTVALASDADELNIDLARRLAAIGPAGLRDRRVMAIVRNPHLAEAMRPFVVDSELTAGFGVSCPDENIAERVCHELDGMLLRRETPAARASDRKWTIHLQSDSSQLSEVIRLWLERFVWSRALLRGASEKFPSLVWETDAGLASVIVVVHDNAGTAAASALRLLNADAPQRRVIAVTDSQLIGHHDALTVVDRVSAAWDERLVFDDIKEQWGRMYHAAYSLLRDSEMRWDEIHDKREGVSSVAAGQNLLRLLSRHGFILFKTDSAPAPPPLSDAIFESIAQGEHEDWLVRKWVDDDGTSGDARRSGSEFGSSWSSLDDEQRALNIALTRAVLPALAAWFGYEIRSRPPVLP